MADYQVIYCDIKTGSILGNLPLTSFQYENVLSAPGSAKFVTPLHSSLPREYTDLGGSGATPYYTPELSLTYLAVGRTAIYVERDGVVVWSGILWNIDMDVNSNTATLSCEGWHSYWRKRYLRVEVIYSSAVDDQTAIAKELIDWSQSQSGGNINIDTSAVVTTGIKRDRNWKEYERKNIGQLLEELTQIDDGFDWYYRTTRSGGVYTTQFLILYPKTGRVAPIRFEMGANIDVLRCTIDGKTMADYAEATGSGEGSAALSYEAIDANALNLYPLLEDQLSFSDVTDVNTLAQYAKRRVQAGKTPVIIPTIQVNPNLDPVFGSYDLGDQVTVVGSYGLLELNAQYRITAISVSVSGNSKETVTVNLAPAEIYESGN